MKHALLVSATDLDTWADHRAAQADLPRLVRRLIQSATQRVVRLSMAAGDGIQQGGWDGLVESTGAHAFVPDGVSAWELSVNAQIKQKADADYTKRTANPRNISPANTTFVFVTPRRWSGKDDWAAKRKREGVWRDVRAYDADDLEAWLEQAYSVQLWLSSILGKSTTGVTDLDGQWVRWTEATRPTITADFLLAGRGKLVADVHSWLRGSTEALAIRGDSRDEVVAVFIAAVQQLPEPERSHFISRSLVVTEPAAWAQVIGSAQPLLLLCHCDAPDAAAHARQNNHRVVLPLGRSDGVSPSTIDIPPLDVHAATEVLVKLGRDHQEATELATLARRGLLSFRRKLAVSPERQQPRWARPATGPALCPALLAGTWDDTGDGDREAIAQLAGAPYESVNGTLIQWWREDDAPLRQVSDRWIITSKEDAWSLLARYVTRDQLARFESVAEQVLATPDPRFDLPKDRRWFASVVGHAPRHSELLKQGLADTLALMAARPLAIGASQSPSDSARRVVRAVMLKANADWRVWASISSLLPLLAEAAPEEFLQAAEHGIGSSDPVLLRLLGEEEDVMLGRAPHTGLLWALETLAWSPDHLCRATLLLAKLARLDPGGKLSNRPDKSLRDIFLPWNAQTSATLAQRLEVLDAIRTREPAVAWRLQRSLLPENHSVGSFTPVPRWREWAPQSRRRVAPDDRYDCARELVSRMVEDAGLDGQRWSDLVSAIGELPRKEHELLASRLEQVDVGRMSTSSASAVWHAFRRMVSKHRSFPNAEWALPAEPVTRLAAAMSRFEPTAPDHRFSWLFDHRPELPDGREHDHRMYERAVSAARTAALRAVSEASGLDGVLQIVRAAKVPGFVGDAAGRAGLLEICEDEVFVPHLGSRDPELAQFAAGLVCGRVAARGRAWGETKLAAESSAAWPDNTRAAFLTCLAVDARTFTLAESMGGSVEKLYWSTVAPFWVGSANDVEHVVRKLIEHGRARAAVDFLGSRHDLAGGVPPVTIAEALEAAVQVQEPWSPRGYEIGELLDVLAASSLDEARVARIEWAYLPALDHEKDPVVLHRELARNPLFYADVVGCVYRRDGENVSPASEAESARARIADTLLDSWRTLPGVGADGSLHGPLLAHWVTQARDALRARGILAAADCKLGELLSASPNGEDGVWPHAAVRDVVETAESPDLERGVHIGLLNGRGAEFRSLRTGGEPERQLAERYAGFATKVRNRWPRTATLLDQIAESYRTDARREDQRRDLRDDTGL
jgi:hypothetical protein